MKFKAINRDPDEHGGFLVDLFVKQNYGQLTLALNSWFLQHNFEQEHIILLKDNKNVINILYHLLNYWGLANLEDLKAETKEKWAQSIWVRLRWKLRPLCSDLLHCAMNINWV